MRKLFITLAIILGAIVIALFIARATGMLLMYKCPTGANEPTIKLGSTIFVSNTVTPKRFDFVCYKGESPVPGGDTVVYGKANKVYRLCGLPDDVVEIKQGDLYINNNPVDGGLTLRNEYRLHISEYNKVEAIITLDESMSAAVFRDSGVLMIDKQFLTANNIKATRFIYPVAEVDITVKKIFKQPWNADNFGPVTVPAGKYFLLGDNRHAAYDSRYEGFADISDYVGTVVWR